MSPPLTQPCAYGGYGASRLRAGEANQCKASKKIAGRSKGWEFAATVRDRVSGLLDRHFNEDFREQVLTAVWSLRSPGSDYICRNCARCVVEAATAEAERLRGEGASQLRNVMDDFFQAVEEAEAAKPGDPNERGYDLDMLIGHGGDHPITGLSWEAQQRVRARAEAGCSIPGCPARCKGRRWDYERCHTIARQEEAADLGGERTAWLANGNESATPSWIKGGRAAERGGSEAGAPGAPDDETLAPPKTHISLLDVGEEILLDVMARVGNDGDGSITDGTDTRHRGYQFRLGLCCKQLFKLYQATSKGQMRRLQARSKAQQKQVRKLQKSLRNMTSSRDDWRGRVEGAVEREEAMTQRQADMTLMKVERQAKEAKDTIYTLQAMVAAHEAHIGKLEAEVARIFTETVVSDGAVPDLTGLTITLVDSSNWIWPVAVHQ